jgi:hypothetical protein
VPIKTASDKLATVLPLEIIRGCTVSTIGKELVIFCDGARKAKKILDYAEDLCSLYQQTPIKVIRIRYGKGQYSFPVPPIRYR